MTTHPELAEAVLATLREKGAKHADALAFERADRLERDKAIRWAAEHGLGVREIARAMNMDASQVSRIIRS